MISRSDIAIYVYFRKRQEYEKPFSWKSKTISVVSSNAMTRALKFKFSWSNFQDLDAYMYKNSYPGGDIFGDIELYHETM